MAEHPLDSVGVKDHEKQTEVKIIKKKSNTWVSSKTIGHYFNYVTSCWCAPQMGLFGNVSSLK